MVKTAGGGRWSGWIALLWAAAFLYLGLMPSSQVPEMLFGRADLVFHFGYSALLAMLVGEWLLMRRSMTEAVAMRLASLVSVAVGITIEILQLASATRSFEMWDLIADGAGAVGGVGLYVLALSRFRSATVSAWVSASGVTGLFLSAMLVLLL